MAIIQEPQAGERETFTSTNPATGEVVGTFAVYHESAHRPSDREQRLVERLSHLASVAIDHEGLFGARAEEAHAIAMHGKPRRLRVSGSASVSDSDPLLSETVGAQLIVRVTARAIFPNCPRYIPTMASVEPSIYVPTAGHDVPEPAWKGFADFKDCIHPRQPTFKG